MTEKETAKTIEKNVKDETYMHEKYTTQDLGDRKVQYERIMSTNYEWKNLNPYYVLQLGIDATEEDIKQRLDIFLLVYVCLYVYLCYMYIYSWG
jgi:hypothetical protein